MDNTLQISDLTVGQKVIIGSKQSFGIVGTISNIFPDEEFPIKVNAGLGKDFELTLESYTKTWSLLK